MDNISTLLEGTKNLLELGVAALEIKEKLSSIFQEPIESRSITFLKQLNIYYFKEKMTGIHQENLDELLTKIKEDKNLSETLFFVFQRVIRSASRYIAPSIMAIITAQLLNEKREPSFKEELIFQACETLTDTDFKNFISYFEEKKELIKKRDDHFFIHLSTQTADRDDAKISPQKHVEKMGSWAVKLKKAGVLRDDISQRIENVPQRELSKTLGGSGKIVGNKSLLYIYHDLIIEQVTFELLDLAKRIIISLKTEDNEND